MKKREKYIKSWLKKSKNVLTRQIINKGDSNVIATNGSGTHSSSMSAEPNYTRYWKVSSVSNITVSEAPGAELEIPIEINGYIAFGDRDKTLSGSCSSGTANINLKIKYRLKNYIIQKLKNIIKINYPIK